MIEGNKVEVFLSDELREKTKLFSLEKDLAICGDHDNGFKLLNNEYKLDIIFEDICNFSIDYANNGHLAFVLATPWLLIAIPETPSKEHLKILKNILDNLDGNNLAIYAYINNKFEQYVFDEKKYKDNKDMLVKVLKKKKLID